MSSPLLVLHREFVMWHIIQRGREAAQEYLSCTDDNEKFRLSVEITAGKSALDLAISDNIPLVLHTLRKMNVIAPYPEDMMQTGIEGLIHAVQRYDPNRGEFSTYAVPYIRKFILQYMEKDTATSIPRTVQKKIYLLRAIHRDFYASVGREPTLGEKSALMLMPEHEVTDVILSRSAGVSLNKPLKAGSENTLADVLADYDVDTGLDLDTLVSVLDQREYTIIHNRYLREDGLKLSAATIGESLGLTSQRVGQLERQALQKMRNFLLELQEQHHV